MVKVGLTGGIASGKSTVSQCWVEWGAYLIDSDVLAREVIAPGTDGAKQVREAFGAEVFAADGTLDRAALGRHIFADPSARSQLEGIIHPLVFQRTQEKMAAAPADAIVVHDIPLLVELGRAADYDKVVIVAASTTERLRRLIEDRQMSPADAQARIVAQATDEQRRAVADFWIDNSGSVADLRARAYEVWQHLLALQPPAA